MSNSKAARRRQCERAAAVRSMSHAAQKAARAQQRREAIMAMRKVADAFGGGGQVLS